MGIVATLAANVAHGLSHGIIGAVVAAWPALALVGSYELLMVIIRGARGSSRVRIAWRAPVGIAWNKFAVRSILINPRYTSHQVWNKQQKDEVLIDVEDVALGHTTKLRWNDTGKWLWSGKIVQPPIIDRDTFDQVQVMVSGRATKHAEHKPHRRQHPYALRSLVFCGLCDWDAKPLGQRRTLLSLPLPRRVRARQPRAAPAEHQPPRGRGHRPREQVAGPRVRPSPHERDDDQAEIFRQLGLRLTYHPGRQLVQAQIEAPQHWYSESVRGAAAPNNPWVLAAEFSLVDGGAR